MALPVVRLLSVVAVCMHSHAVLAGCGSVQFQSISPLTFSNLRYQSDLKSGWINVAPDGEVRLSRGLSMATGSRIHPARVSMRVLPGTETILRVTAVDSDDSALTDASFELDLSATGAIITKVSPTIYSVYLEGMRGAGASSAVDLIFSGTLRVRKFAKHADSIGTRYQVSCIAVVSR